MRGGVVGRELGIDAIDGAVGPGDDLDWRERFRWGVIQERGGLLLGDEEAIGAGESEVPEVLGVGEGEEKVVGVDGAELWGQMEGGAAGPVRFCDVCWVLVVGLWWQSDRDAGVCEQGQDGVWEGCVGIPSEVMALEGELGKVAGGGDSDPVAPAIASQAERGEADCGFDESEAGMEAEIRGGEIEELGWCGVQ